MEGGIGGTDPLRRCGSDEERRSLLGKLLQEYEHGLRTFIARGLQPGLRRRLDPSDVLQEAYLEATRRLVYYLERSRVPFFIWLKFLVHQKVWALARHHRLACRDFGREVSVDVATAARSFRSKPAGAAAGQDGSPVEEASDREMLHRLRQAIDRLRPRDQEIIELRDLHLLTSHQAALALDISQEAVRRRHSRARKRLKLSFDRVARPARGIRAGAVAAGEAPPHPPETLSRIASNLQ